MFRAITRLATLEEPTYVWRGHESMQWGLVPSINRKLNVYAPLAAAALDAKQTAVDAETHALMAAARSHRHHVLDGWEMPDLPLLALLQHNGAATPLLDVTTDPIVALHFASQHGPGNDTDGLLIAIDARESKVETFAVGEGASWSQALARLENKGKPLGLYTPPMVTPRIMAQRGRFLFGSLSAGLGYSVLGVREPASWTQRNLVNLFNPEGPGRLQIPPVVVIRIPRGDKEKIRSVIATSFGLNNETLFPDFPGFADAHAASGPILSA